MGKNRRRSSFADGKQFIFHLWRQLAEQFYTANKRADLPPEKAQRKRSLLFAAERKMEVMQNLKMPLIEFGDRFMRFLYFSKQRKFADANERIRNSGASRKHDKRTNAAL